MLELGGWLDAACKERQLPDPHSTVSEELGNNDASSAVFVRALCSRLCGLGYLEQKYIVLEKMDAAVSKAIRAFQGDAGFTGNEIDGWVGPKTMRRLQQLVSFEEEQDPSTWDWLKGSPYDYQVVQRAVLLRLQTFGYCWDQDLRPNRTFDFRDEKPLKKALSSFLAATTSLGLAPAGQEPALSFETLRLVFGQDQLVKAIAVQPDSYFNAPSNQRFIQSIGRVELWLHGYDVSIGKPPRRPNGTPGIPTPVEGPLSEFWACFPEDRSIDKSRFARDFFKQILALDDAPDPGIDERTNAKIMEVVKANQSKVLDKLRNFASRVWDGIKRVWNWLKGVLSDAANKIEHLLDNIARLVSRGAREAYATVVKAVEIVERGTVYLTKSVFPGSDPSSAVLSFDGDLDARLFIAENARGEHLKYLLDSDALHTRCFSAACRILAILLDAVGTVLQVLVKPVVGWLTALLGLSRIVRDILSLKDIIEQFDFSSQEAILRTREG